MNARLVPETGPSLAPIKIPFQGYQPYLFFLLRPTCATLPDTWPKSGAPPHGLFYVCILAPKRGIRFDILAIFLFC